MRSLLATRSILIPLLALLAFCLATPSLAYTIYLKDGSQLNARDKYVVRDGKAIITLQNGTRVSYDASQIDVARTEEANQNDYGSAVILDEGKPAPRRPAPVEQKTTITDLINRKRTGLRGIPESRRPVQAPNEGDVVRTPGGYLDLVAWPRNAYPDVDLAGELQRQFRAQQIETVNVYSGPGEKAPLVEVETNTEASIFRAVAVACNALLEIRKSRPAALEELNLLLINSRNERAGQFQISPEMAQALLGRRIEISAFYVAYVQF
jgi:hypothetical protein